MPRSAFLSASGRKKPAIFGVRFSSLQKLIYHFEVNQPVLNTYAELSRQRRFMDDSVIQPELMEVQQELGREHRVGIPAHLCKLENGVAL